MMDIEIGLFSGGIVLTFIIVFIFSFVASRKPHGLPPGSPWTLPFVGDLPLFITGDILTKFRKLRNRHGDVFSFYMGGKLTIVINSYKLIHHAGVQKGAFFTGRPKNFFSFVSGEGGQGLVMAEGPLWQRQSKFIYDQLHAFGFGKSSFESKILPELAGFIDYLREQNGKPFHMKETINISMANIVFSLVCGRRHDYNDQVFMKILKTMNEETQEFLRVSLLNTCFPFLKYLPLDPFKMKISEHRNEYLRTLVIRLYDEHMQKLNQDRDKPTEDLMDAYIREMEKPEHSINRSDFSFDQLCAVMTDLLGAGANTSATVIRWAILYLLHYPDIKRRLQSDIDSVIGSQNSPCLDDRQKLPFVEAFIMEVLRITNIAPLGMPRAILGDKDIAFEGYRIPKDSAIIFNYETSLFDPETFPEPEKFKPERFIDNSGHLLKPNQLIPFGIGRRVCLGEPVARMELFLFLTTVIREFNILPEDDDAIPPLKAVIGIVNSPVDYKFRAVRRSKIYSECI